MTFNVRSSFAASFASVAALLTIATAHAQSSGQASTSQLEIVQVTATPLFGTGAGSAESISHRDAESLRARGATDLRTVSLCSRGVSAAPAAMPALPARCQGSCSACARSTTFLLLIDGIPPVASSSLCSKP